MRRIAAPNGITVRRFSVNSFKEKLHYHGCDRCRGRYSCSCDMPGVDTTCGQCRGGHTEKGLSTWQAATAPRDCCREQARTATNRERETYKLAGPGPWWVCTHCWRTHPKNPRSPR